VRWLADECVDGALVEEMRKAGHDVVYLAQIDRQASDEQVINRANEEFRLLLTEDKDFGELVFWRNRGVPGLVLLRVRQEQRWLKWMQLQGAITQFGDPVWPTHRHR
jgi:predicted nuclease of predicted toxin-antitoxin system